MKQKTLTFLIALTVLFSFAIPAVAVDTGFSDVPTDAYYAEAVNYVREQGLMNGTSATTFAPNATTSRSQLTAILWRQAGRPEAGGAAFSDVPAAAYYATAAAWANERGIVTGYSDGRFGPDDPITRAQLATILWRADGSPAVSSQTAFADQGSIPSYAVSAVAWTRNEGIINGRDGNLFDPDGSATRAQTAAILYRYLTRDGQNGAPTTPVNPDNTQSSGSTVLVAYFSATGNTETIAEYIAADLDADLYEITPAVPYSAADISYTADDTRAEREQNDPNARPEISGSVANMDQYDTVFIGYPIWWGRAPRIISTFLESYSFGGKTIVPFWTSSSSGIGDSATELHPLASSVTWKDGIRFAGGTAHSAVTSWIDTLNLDERQEETSVTKINVQVGTSMFTATLEQNAAVEALVEMMEDGPVVLQMSDYSGFEKVGALGQSLPTNNSQTTTHTGDIVLYNGNQIVIFYGSNSWSYTRLGKIDDLSGWADALGRGDVQVTFTISS